MALWALKFLKRKTVLKVRWLRLWIFSGCLLLSSSLLAEPEGGPPNNVDAIKTTAPEAPAGPSPSISVNATQPPTNVVSDAIPRDDTLSKADQPADDLATQGFKTIATLILMIAILLGIAWFVRKNGTGRLLRSSDISIRSFLNLGNKEKIALIKVKDKEILVGVTSTHIQTLHVFNADDQSQAAQAESVDGSNQS